MKPSLSYFYGLHPSYVFGLSIGIDPLLPPRKCLLDCITCPLGKSVHYPRDFNTSVNCGQMVSSLAKYISHEPGSRKAVTYIWGFGDPLLVPNIEDIVLNIKKFFTERGIDVHILLHSSGMTLTRIIGKKKLIDEIDHIIIPFMWCGEDPFANGWPQGVSISNYIEVLKLFNRNYRDKVILEIPVFRSRDKFYPSLIYIDEIVACIEKIGTVKILVKPLKRPSIGHEVKDVSLKYIEQVKKNLENHGVYIIDKIWENIDKIELNLTSIYEILYNHLLRKPLRHDEIKSVYGDLGILALHNLLEKNIVTRINWDGRVFFKGVF